MEQPLLKFGIAAAVVAAGVAGVLYFTRGSHLQLEGKILKVRTAPIDEKSSVAVLDFRYLNTADVTFNVLSVTVILEESSGMRNEGTTVSELDAQRLFQALPLLGQKYNPSLVMRNKIPGHANEDRMIAARFEVPEERLEKRKRFLIRIEDVDGAVSEISE